MHGRLRAGDGPSELLETPAIGTAAEFEQHGWYPIGIDRRLVLGGSDRTRLHTIPNLRLPFRQMEDLDGPLMLSTDPPQDDARRRAMFDPAAVAGELGSAGRCSGTDGTYDDRCWMHRGALSSASEGRPPIALANTARPGAGMGVNPSVWLEPGESWSSASTDSAGRSRP